MQTRYGYARVSSALARGGSSTGPTTPRSWGRVAPIPSAYTKRSYSINGVMKIVGYTRVSTDEQADSGLGLAAQREAIQTAASSRGWDLVGIVEDAGVSGTVALGERPGFSSVLRDLESGEVDGVVVAKLDRLSRRLAHSTQFLDLVDRNRWHLSVLDVNIDTSTAGGRLVANLMGSVNQHFRDVIAENTKAALAAKLRRGERLGRPVTLAQETRQRITSDRTTGMTLQAIADALNEEGVPTARGGAKWYPGTVRKVLLSVDLDRAAGEEA